VGRRPSVNVSLWSIFFWPVWAVTQDAVYLVPVRSHPSSSLSLGRCPGSCLSVGRWTRGRSVGGTSPKKSPTAYIPSTCNIHHHIYPIHRHHIHPIRRHHIHPIDPQYTNSRTYSLPCHLPRGSASHTTTNSQLCITGSTTLWFPLFALRGSISLFPLSHFSLPPTSTHYRPHHFQFRRLPMERILTLPPLISPLRTLSRSSPTCLDSVVCAAIAFNADRRLRILARGQDHSRECARHHRTQAGRRGT
jgi:hypothetical protein